MSSKIKTFLKTKPNWIYIISVIFAIVGLLISFIFKEYSHQIIGMMFTIIVVDNFLMLIFYMDDIKHKSDDIKKDIESIKCKLENTQVGSIKYSLSSCDEKKAIFQAKKSIFFSGAGMTFFNYDLANSLANTEPYVEINCVVTDLNNPDVKKAMDYLFRGIKKGKQSVSRLSFDRQISRIRSARNINVDFITTFSHISYFAIDYKEQTESSFIQAKHYLVQEYAGEVKVFYCIVRPGTELYKYYLDQIFLLEKKGQENR